MLSSLALISLHPDLALLPLSRLPLGCATALELLGHPDLARALFSIHLATKDPELLGHPDLARALLSVHLPTKDLDRRVGPVFPDSELKSLSQVMLLHLSPAALLI